MEFDSQVYFELPLLLVIDANRNVIPKCISISFSCISLLWYWTIVDHDVVHHLFFKLTELSLIFPVVRLLAGEFGISDFYRILLSIISWKLLIQPLFPHSALIGCINNFTTWNFSNNIQISNWKFFFFGQKIENYILLYLCENLSLTHDGNTRFCLLTF